MSLRVLAALWALCSHLALARTTEEGRKFLEENKKRPGIRTTSSGLQYKILKKGTGVYHPADNATCTMHYAGTTLNMTPNFLELDDEEEWECFDSSYEKGEYKYFTTRMVVPGIGEAMSMMVVGAKWEIYMPGNLGYGGTKGGGPKIKPHEMLVFRVEILEIEGETIKAKCDYDTREFCDEGENEILDNWYTKPAKEIEKKIKQLKKKVGYTIKMDDQNHMNKQMRILREFVKLKKQKKEL